MAGVPPELTVVLAASVGDWIERVGPLILFAGAMGIVVLRAKERRRGPDEDDDF